MPAPKNARVSKQAARLDFTVAALRKILARPLKAQKPSEPNFDTVFNRIALQDPVNAALEGEIIPRLMARQIVGGSLGPKEERIEIGALDTQKFLGLPIAGEAPDIMKEVDRFLDQGLRVEDVYLDLLEPAARHLGELWCRDECDFVDVTMGLWRLQEVMREISLRSPPQSARPDAARGAVFCPIPGDVHSFGAQMIEDVFARAGWRSEVLLKPQRRELLDYVSNTPLDLVGLTVSRRSPISALASLVTAIRSVSPNPKLAVLVGGHMINQNPTLVADIGADGTGVDARAALATAERLIPAAPNRARMIAGGAE